MAVLALLVMPIVDCVQATAPQSDAGMACISATNAVAGDASTPTLARTDAGQQHVQPVPQDAGLPSVHDDNDAGSLKDSTGCPGDLPGPKLVMVPAPTGGTYCIDGTEVARGDYALFLSAQSMAAGLVHQAAACQWNTSYVPATWKTQTDDKLPIVDVDWCDAAAYCTWAGKRLCGKIGGGANDYTHYADPKQSQWYNACSAGGVKTYPYGDTYRGSTCNGYERAAGGVVAVGQMNACEGGYPGLFDMSGNVEEWEDSCTGATGADDQCQFRGGSYNDGVANARLNCDFAGNSTSWYGTRASSDANLGFRCCRD